MDGGVGRVRRRTREAARVVAVSLLAVFPACNWTRAADEPVKTEEVEVGAGLGISTTTRPSQPDPAVTTVVGEDDGGDGEPPAPRADVPSDEPSTSSSSPSVSSRPADPALDERSVGALGNALLRGDVPGVVVEVDTVPGLDLTPETSAAIEDTLKRHGRKQAVRFTLEESLPEQERYTLDDLRVLADEGRRNRSGNGRVAVHVLVLSGQFELDQVAVAFAATSFAVFPDAIGRNTPYADYAAGESEVVLHEMGHLFGLVNITGVGGFHEDPDHPGHSPNVDSLMHFTVDRGRSGPPTLDPREFDADDRREMEAIRRMALPEGVH